MFLYVWLVPVALAAVCTAFLLGLPVPPSITGPGGVLSIVIQISALLPGFFLAALAAVSTFQRPEMDVDMPAPAPVVKLRLGADNIEYTVTRRMFLSYLFSYLTIASLLIVVLSAIADLAGPSFSLLMSQIEDVDARNFAYLSTKILFVGFLMYWCSSILVSTLHGIYFLTERMHQPN